MEEQIKKLLSDPSFVKEMNTARTEDEVIVLFSENGVDATFEDILSTVTSLPGGKASDSPEEPYVIRYDC